MKKQFLFCLLTLCISTITLSQTVNIGGQVWATNNLDVSTFRNGDVITQAKNNAEWIKLSQNKQPAWCYYNNDEANGTKYGKLYNWYAVKDPRGLAPLGYHIPSDDEWRKLTTFLKEGVGSKMKSTIGWEHDGNGTNSSGFGGLPGGNCVDDGTFFNIGLDGNWWSSSELNSNPAGHRNLYCLSSELNSGYPNNGAGLSVRCIKN